MKRILFIFLSGLLVAVLGSCELFPPLGGGGDNTKEHFTYLGTNCPDGKIESNDKDGNYLCTEEDGGLKPTLLHLRCAPEELRPNPCPPVPPTQVPGTFIPIPEFRVIIHAFDPDAVQGMIMTDQGKVFAASNQNIVSYDEKKKMATIGFALVNESLIDEDLVLVMNTNYLSDQQKTTDLTLKAELLKGAFSLK